ELALAFDDVADFGWELHLAQVEPAIIPIRVVRPAAEDVVPVVAPGVLLESSQRSGARRAVHGADRRIGEPVQVSRGGVHGVAEDLWALPISFGRLLPAHAYGVVDRLPTHAVVVVVAVIHLIAGGNLLQ